MKIQHYLKFSCPVCAFVAPPSMAPCGVRPTWTWGVRKMHGAIFCPPILGHSSHRPPWLLAEYDPHGRGECGKCMEQFSARPSLGIRRTALRGSLRHTAHPWAFVAPPSMAPCDIPPILGHKKTGAKHRLKRRESYSLLRDKL